jgi:hypothetical protein
MKIRSKSLCNESSKERSLLFFTVYGLLIVGPHIELIKTLKLDLQITFDMSDSGELNYFLSLQVCKIHDGLFLSQSKYALYIF